MIEHRAVINFFLAMDRQLGTAPGVWLAVTSLSFDISVLELLWTLTRGFRIVLYADESKAAASLPAHAHRGIEFSLFYFSAAGGADASGRRDKYRLLLEGARFADRNDFAAVWTPERHFHAFGGLYPNPSVTSAAVAAVTERVGIRAGSCVLPLHHPVRVVEEWSMVDNLSNGRVGVSVAAGWQPNDFVLRPDAYARAKDLMFEGLETVRRLWRGESVTLPGPLGDVTLQCLPRPVQPELPIWVTTAGNVETFEAAGRVGGRVLTHLLGQSVAEVGTKITAYRAAWRAAGYEGEGHVTLMLHTFVGQDTAQVKELVREPMKSYLRTSINLIKDFAASFPTFKRTDGNLDFEALSPDEFDALLDYSFERYFEMSGLFGDFARTVEMVDRLKGIGVDEIACLIDFGVDDDLTLTHLHHLNRLRRLTSTPRVEGRQSVAALIERHGVTHLQCTPSMASIFVAGDDSRAALGRLQCLLVGGEALTPALARDLRAATGGRILNLYGPTETTIWSTCAEVDDGPVTVGRPLLNTRIFVLDPAGRPVPPGMAGELYIGGHGVARGYWNRPELTEDRFVPEPFGGPEQGTQVYRTGDRVRFDGTGRLEFLGRLDQQVKLRGYRIELGEIEAQLSTHPAVRETAVVVREDRADDVRIVAYLVSRAETTPDALREWLKTRLPEFMLPAVFVFLADLPRTPNRKIDRKALPAPREARPAPTRPSPVQSDLERRITASWEEALRVDAVGLDDNFFDLGGHSLLAVQVHARLKRELAPQLAITDLFRYPTVRSLARFLEGGADTRQLKASVERGSARRAALERRAGARQTKTP
jgi:natural product biosynthesis luciferase-like monooxygenase protein